MEEEVKKKEAKKSATAIWGTPIAWIVIYGALCGATALIPIFPYVGGGGYLPLSAALAAIAPMLMGPAGIIAAFLGGIIGMFIAPAAYPLGLADAVITGTLPAVFVSLTANDDKYWYLTVPLIVAVGILHLVFPFYIPGGDPFTAPPQPYYTLIAAWFFVPWAIIMISPLGTNYVPKWLRSEDRQKMYAAMFIAYISALGPWMHPWFIPYWYLFGYSGALGAATLTGYSWWFPALSAVITLITVPIIEGLRRSGLPPIRLAVWSPEEE